MSGLPCMRREKVFVTLRGMEGDRVIRFDGFDWIVQVHLKVDYRWHCVSSPDVAAAVAWRALMRLVLPLNRLSLSLYVCVYDIERGWWLVSPSVVGSRRRRRRCMLGRRRPGRSVPSEAKAAGHGPGGALADGRCPVDSVVAARAPWLRIFRGTVPMSGDGVAYTVEMVTPGQEKQSERERERERSRDDHSRLARLHAAVDEFKEMPPTDRRRCAAPCAVSEQAHFVFSWSSVINSWLNFYCCFSVSLVVN